MALVLPCRDRLPACGLKWNRQGASGKGQVTLSPAVLLTGNSHTPNHATVLQEQSLHVKVTSDGTLHSGAEARVDTPLTTYTWRCSVFV